MHSFYFRSVHLDSNWQRPLKKKAIIAYDEWNYIRYIKDLDKITEEYIRRTNRKNRYPIDRTMKEEKDTVIIDNPNILKHPASELVSFQNK